MCVTFPTQTLLLSSSSVKGSAMSLSCSYTHNQAITKFCRLYLQNVSQVPFPPPPGTAASVHAAILPPGDCFFQPHNWCSCVCPCHSTQWPEWFFYLKKSHYGILPLKNGRVTSQLISIERKAKVTSVSWRDLTSLLLSWPSNPFYLTSMLQPPWLPWSSSSMPGMLPLRTSFLKSPSSWKSVTWRSAWVFPHLL